MGTLLRLSTSHKARLGLTCLGWRCELEMSCQDTGFTLTFGSFKYPVCVTKVQSPPGFLEVFGCLMMATQGARERPVCHSPYLKLLGLLFDVLAIYGGQDLQCSVSVFSAIPSLDHSRKTSFTVSGTPSLLPLVSSSLVWVILTIFHTHWLKTRGFGRPGSH